MLSSQAENTDYPTMHPTCAAVGQSQCAPQHDVSAFRRETPTAEQVALDEGVDYFSAQGAIDRWKVQRA